MKTNDLKKGDRVRLRNGWYATIMDNKKGNIRFCDVEGFEREMGSVYAHDIVGVVKGGDLFAIEHTPAQVKLRQVVEGVFA